jgi:hypothetical protein
MRLGGFSIYAFFAVQRAATKSVSTRKFRQASGYISLAALVICQFIRYNPPSPVGIPAKIHVQEF